MADEGALHPQGEVTAHPPEDTPSHPEGGAGTPKISMSTF